jgi:hypothetical protein
LMFGTPCPDPGTAQRQKDARYATVARVRSRVSGGACSAIAR